MPISTKIVALAASATVLVTGGGLALGATPQGQAAVAAVAQAVLPKTEISVVADGTKVPLALLDPTVDLALENAGITVGEHDRLYPALGTELVAGNVVTVKRVEITRHTNVVPLDFPTTEVEDPTLTKGERRTKEEGAQGTREDVIETVTVDGHVESTTTISETVTAEPVARVIQIGTYVAPTPTPTPAPQKRKAPTQDKKAPSQKEAAPDRKGGAINLARADMWDRIAQCESGGRWSINTGNGYYGGLQFNLGTWKSVNGTDFAAYPHQASRAEQITVANRLYAQRGLQPWGCRHAA